MSAYRPIGGFFGPRDGWRTDFAAKLRYVLAIGRMNWECKKPLGFLSRPISMNLW